MHSYFVERSPNTNPQDYFGETFLSEDGQVRYIVGEQKYIYNSNPNSLIKEIVIGEDSNNTNLLFADSESFDEINRSRMHLLCGPDIIFSDGKISKELMETPELKAFCANDLVKVVEYINFTPDMESYYERPLVCLLRNNPSKIAEIIAKEFNDNELAEKYLHEISRDRAEKIARSLALSKIQKIFNKIAEKGIDSINDAEYKELNSACFSIPKNNNSDCKDLQTKYNLKTGAFYNENKLFSAVINFMAIFGPRLVNKFENCYLVSNNPFVKFSPGTQMPTDITDKEMLESSFGKKL